MYSRNAIRLFACAALLGSAGSIEMARAQGAPFTIRRPPDGSTVREKVSVEIPRQSIDQGGFIALYLDDKFYVAVPPDETGAHKPFTFVWDTKGSGVTDGPHSIKAVLYVPSPENNTAVTEKSSTSVRLNVANKIHDGPSVLRLRYKLPAGQDLQYSRNSTAKVTNSGISVGETNDTLLAETSSKLLLNIISPAPLALVRNKLTELSVLQQGQEISLDKSQLSASMYQEVDPVGKVEYETGTGAGLDESMAQGLPVNNTIELPLLPTSAVAIGQSWMTPNQRLDIPGLPPSQQPKVTLRNTLVDLEWEGGHPTAKIHQSYDAANGASLPAEIQFGSIPVTTPQVKFERDIYFAYKAGMLVKTVRTVTVTGRTTVQTDQATPSAPAGGMMGGPGMMGGMGRGMMGGMSGMTSSSPGGMVGGMGGMTMGGKGRGMGSSMGGPGMMGGMGRGMMGGGMGRGMMGGPGQMGGMTSSSPGSMGSGGGMGRGMMGGMTSSSPGGMGGGMGRGMMGPGGGAPGVQEADHPVVLKAVTETELIKVIGP